MIDEEDDDYYPRSESVERTLARKMDYTLRCKNEIRRLYGCEAEYAGREEVWEIYQDENVWSGYVEIFRISGHPEAKRCYAWAPWAGEDEESDRIVAFLELPPIDSPEAAVKAAIIAEIESDYRRNE